MKNLELDKNMEMSSGAINQSFLKEGEFFPLVIEPAWNGVDLLQWVTDNRGQYNEWITKYGGILFRGFGCRMEKFVEIVSGGLLEYNERSSPRHPVGRNVYTSTDHPADEEIFLHNECSYSHTFPTKIFFNCLVEPTDRGGTPLANCRKVYAKIDSTIREKFEKKGIMYVRNYSGRLGLPWTTVFNTEDRKKVEEYCIQKKIEFEWKVNGVLKTKQVYPAVIKHPFTGEMTWFNHGTFFHVTTLPEEIRDFFLETIAEEDLPNNTYYGDGEPIEGYVLDELRRIYRSEAVVFQWKQGDILALDNLLTAHGREPFTGPRKITVAMAEPMSH